MTSPLLSLLPFLALLPLFSATPFDPSLPGRLASRQDATGGGAGGNSTGTGGGGGGGSTAAVAPLSFQGVGDAGISAQMVRASFCRPTNLTPPRSRR